MEPVSVVPFLQFLIACLCIYVLRCRCFAYLRIIAIIQFTLRDAAYASIFFIK